jgi:hypothetical protein
VYVDGAGPTISTTGMYASAFCVGCATAGRVSAQGAGFRPPLNTLPIG